MNHLEILYKLLRWTAQAAIVYLLFRYLPFSKMSTSKSLIATLIVTILAVSIELGCLLYQNMTNKEGFNCPGCMEGFNDVTSHTQTGKCRLVCDGNKEGFEETSEEDKKPLEQIPKATVGYENNGSGFGGMFANEKPMYSQYSDPELLAEGADIAKRNKIRLLREKAAIERQLRSIDGWEGPYQETGPKSQLLENTQNDRMFEGVLTNELEYSDYNHLPLAAGYKSKAYEFGYSFLPPEKWYPQPTRPPVCVTERRQNVMPVYTDSTTADMKEWYPSSRITPIQQINVDYIGEKLNSGR